MFPRNRPSEKGKHTVDHAGSRHGHCKASVHAPIKEANRRALRVVFVAHEAVALVARLCRIDGKDLASLVSPGSMHHCGEAPAYASPRNQSTSTSGQDHRFRAGRILTSRIGEHLLHTLVRHEIHSCADGVPQQMVAEARIQPQQPSVLDQLARRGERSLLLVAARKVFIHTRNARPVHHDFSKLLRILGKLERARDRHDRGAGSRTGNPKAQDRRPVGICAPSVGDDERRGAGGSVNDIIDCVFCLLVNREGHGADNGDGHEWGPDAWVKISVRGDGLRLFAHALTHPAKSL